MPLGFERFAHRSIVHSLRTASARNAVKSVSTGFPTNTYYFYSSAKFGCSTRVGYCSMESALWRTRVGDALQPAAAEGKKGPTLELFDEMQNEKREESER